MALYSMNSLAKEIVWTEYLEATLLDYGGWAAFSGVPKGKNWGAALWHSAVSREGWLQVHATSYDNPFIADAAIDRIRLHTSERFFNQEYLAEIVDDAGGVFRGVVKAATAVKQDKPIDGHSYIVGVG